MILKKNERFKNLHKGQDCIIFGNGGSINYFNLSDFDSNDIEKLVLEYFLFSDFVFVLNSTFVFIFQHNACS